MDSPITLGPTWRRGEDNRFIVPRFSLGWHIADWARLKLQHENGDPWHFTAEQLRFTLWWYAVELVECEWRFVYRDGILQRLKGWGKDPVGAAYSAVEFVGPCRPGEDMHKVELIEQLGLEIPVMQPLGVSHPSAWVQIAAVSKDQTRNTMTLFPAMFPKATIAEYGIDLGKEIIYADHGARRIEAVTSSPRALEGGRATFVIRNETHHWIEANEGHEMDRVISRNATKSKGGSARVLSITNAYDPAEDSVAQRAREAYDEIASGQSEATGILYDSLEAPASAKLTLDEIPEVVTAIRGDSVWLDVERIKQEVLDPRNPPSQSRRFWYNQITATEDAWLAGYEWDACERRDLEVVDGDEVVMFFDGSKSDDATALVGCRMSDGHLFKLGIWERPAHAPKTWLVPRDDVDATVRAAFDRFKVIALWGDPGTGEDESGERYWDASLDEWGADFGKRLLVWAVPGGDARHPVLWDMRGGDSRRVEAFTLAAMRTYTDVMERTLTHDGDKRLRRHVVNARRRPNRWGVSIGKEGRESRKKIDGAVCAVGARMLRRYVLGSKPWQTRRRGGGGRVIVLD